MNKREKLKELLNREPVIIPINFKGEQGFVVEYFNYTYRNLLSQIFGKTEDEAIANLLTHLESVQAGKTVGDTYDSNSGN